MSGASLTKDQVVSYIRQVLPIVVQLKREGGVRRWSEIFFAPYAEWRRRQNRSVAA